MIEDREMRLREREMGDMETGGRASCQVGGRRSEAVAVCLALVPGNKHCNMIHNTACPLT